MKQMKTIYEQTLGSLLSDPRIASIANNAIRNRDLAKEELWTKTLLELRQEQFFTGEIARGIQRLYMAADTGEWYFPLYSEEECQQNPAVNGVSIVWFSSELPVADERPFILVVPGGGFVNVWNLTEGWPIAEQFNRYGYHVFVLTYQVEAQEKLMEKNMQGFCSSIAFHQKQREAFPPSW